MAQRFSREQFENFFNKEIIDLTFKLEQIEEEQERISQRILEIQDECNHEYLMYSSGTHEDAYRCKHCGRYEWR